MKQKALLLMVMTFCITTLLAQKNNKKQKDVTGYAITAVEKGQRSWKEVRLVNITTGEEMETIYNSKQKLAPLNARTGKAVEKKEISFNNTAVKKVVNLDQELDQAVKAKVIHVTRKSVSSDHPFATNSAAMAFDKKHERLYYTPMGINQLRYIDLKSSKIYYFEDDPFGAMSGPGDVPNQITRMVIASDGNGYALTNNCEHLFRFTTGKKPSITDLGALIDDPANGKNSIRNRNSYSGYGGDIIADNKKNIYLITAYRNVFKISLESRIATYLGSIKGLPSGFTTNGAMVEEGSKVIVASAQSTTGYYRFDLNTLEAKKVSASGNVFNASDLANANLAFEKKKKEKQQPEEIKEPQTDVVAEETRKNPIQETLVSKGISVYPNPVTNSFVKISFEDQPSGKYKVQLFDMSGKLITSQEVLVTNKAQVEEFRFPDAITKGNYMLKVSNEANNISFNNKIVVQ